MVIVLTLGKLLFMNNQKIEESFLSILLLNEIAKSKVEVYKNREPNGIYIGKSIVNIDDNILKRILRFKEIGFLERTEDEIFDTYKITLPGKKKLEEYQL